MAKEPCVDMYGDLGEDELNGILIRRGAELKPSLVHEGQSRTELMGFPAEAIGSRALK